MTDKPRRHFLALTLLAAGLLLWLAPLGIDTLCRQRHPLPFGADQGQIVEVIYCVLPPSLLACLTSLLLFCGAVVSQLRPWYRLRWFWWVLALLGWLGSAPFVLFMLAGNTV